MCLFFIYASEENTYEASSTTWRICIKYTHQLRQIYIQTCKIYKIDHIYSFACLQCVLSPSFQYFKQDVPCAMFDVTGVILSLKTSMRQQWHGWIKHYHPSQPATSTAPCNTEALIFLTTLRETLWLILYTVNMYFHLYTTEILWRL